MNRKNRIEALFENKWNAAYLFAGVVSVIAAVKGWTVPLYNLAQAAVSTVLKHDVEPLRVEHPSLAVFFALVLAACSAIATTAALLSPMLCVWLAQKLSVLFAFRQRRSYYVSESDAVFARLVSDTKREYSEKEGRR